MPKLLVLFAGAESVAASLAAHATAGASTVRFTEVDLRSVAPQQATTGVRYKALESTDAIEHYDGVVIATSGEAVPPAIDTLIDAWERSAPNAFANTVFAATGTATTALVSRMARLGGIVLSEARGDVAQDERARLVGMRAAKLVEWIRHALSHEHSRHHEHAEHTHDRSR